MDFTGLRDADIGTVNSVTAAWSKVSAELTDIHSNHRDLRISMTNGAWIGDSADMAISQLALLNEQLNAAKAETKAVHDILIDAADQFAVNQNELTDLIDEIDDIPELTIDDAGIVTLTDNANPHKDLHLEEIWLGLKAEYQDKIDTVVEEATTADENIAEALRLAAETNNDGDITFNAQAMNLDELAEIREAEDTAIELLNSHPSELSDGQLDQLNFLLETHGANPVFATEMLEEMGPDEFLNRAAAHSFQLQQYAPPYGQDDPEGLQRYLDLQENLGYTLAAATDPANGAHISEEWTQRLMNAGAEDLAGDHKPGYLALAPLLEHGEYHEDFLTPVANHMLMQAHSEPPVITGNDLNPYMYDPEDTDESGHNAREGNPLNSMYLALENNPTAAAQVFGADGAPPEYEYNDSDGDPLAPLDKNPVEFTLSNVPQVANIDDLDGALEAAATGLTPGDDTPYPLHTADNVATAEQLMSYFDEHPSDIGHDGKLSKFADNMTTVASNYMVDIQTSFIGDNGAYGEDVKLPGQHADFHTAAVTRVLDSLGEHEDSVLKLAGANQAATEVLVSAGLEHYGGEPSAWLEDAAAPGSRVSGILANGQTDYILDNGHESDTNQNDTVDLIADGVGAVASLKIPGSELLVDPLAESFHVDNLEEYSGEAQHVIAELEEKSADHAAAAVVSALQHHGLTEEEAETWRKQNLSDAAYKGWFQDGRGYVIEYD